MQNYHITKRAAGWVLTAEGQEYAILTAPTKAGIIVQTRAFAVGKVMSVKIHKLNGRIQEERTYPRSSDPRRSPG